jgi:hypothetical protein
VSSEDREALAAVAKDAFYAARDSGRTMHEAADDTADRILAADWVSPDTHRQAIEDAREQGAGDTERLIRDAVRRAEAERDDWHARHCAAMATVERVRALRDRWESALEDGCPSCGRFVADCDHNEGYHHALSDLRAALNGAPELDTKQTEWVDIHRDCGGNWHVDDGIIRYCDDCGYAEHVLVDATKLPVRKRDGGES